MKTALTLFGILACYLVAGALEASDGMMDAAQREADFQRQEEQIARTIVRVCGQNAAWSRVGSVVQCFTHRGYKTIKFEL